MAIDKKNLHDFILARGAGVISTVAKDGSPQAAHVYLAATPALDLIFYTLGSNRKCANLRHDPRVAAVIGWDGEQTLQYEGIAFEPNDDALVETKNVFLHQLHDLAGQAQWPGLVFFRVRPVWIRFSSYARPWRVDEYAFPENRSYSGRGTGR